MKIVKGVVGLLLVLAATVPALADATQTTHIYNLAGGSYADQYGGPSIQGNGGSLTSSGYTFGADQGLTLTGAMDPYNYSIEMVFTLPTIPSGWLKLMDFHNQSTYMGLYLLNGYLYYYAMQGSNALIQANQSTNLIVTRDGATNQFSAYVNGQEVMSFIDTGWPYGGTDLLDNNINLFMAGSGPGTVSLVRTYDGALTQPQVTLVDDDGQVLTAPASVPEPGSIILLTSGLAALVGLKRRRR